MDSHTDLCQCLNTHASKSVITVLCDGDKCADYASGYLQNTVFYVKESSDKLQGLLPLDTGFPFFHQGPVALALVTIGQSSVLTSTHRTTRKSVFRLRIVFSDDRSVMA